MSYTYQYPRPAVTVDVILITKEETPKVLLIQRKNNPYKDKWAFPGGFVDMDEDLTDAAERELNEETGIIFKNLTQFKTYGTPGRDPRGRTISIVYYAFTDQTIEAQGMDDACDAKWFSLNDAPILAFDHEVILKEFTDYIKFPKEV